MFRTKPKRYPYRLTNAGDYMSNGERLMMENVIAWRVIAIFGVSIVFCYWLTGKFIDAGLSPGQADFAVFLTVNMALFIACLRSWRRSVFPLAPRGWRRGIKARIAIAVFVFHFSLLAYAPVHVQLAAAFIVAWYKFNFIDLQKR